MPPLFIMPDLAREVSCIMHWYPVQVAIGVSLAHRKLSMNIFVGNLEFSATEQDVRQMFERYGVVDTVRIMTDRETGRPRGFGFVEMPDDTAARAAITGLQGTALGGRTLNVNEARPREERPRPRRERW
jgi:RNA recognition motif-containing protein